MTSNTGMGAFTLPPEGGGQALYVNATTVIPHTSSYYFSTENQTELIVGTAYPNYQDEEYPFDDPKVRAIFLVLYTIVFCSCFFGNLMVILVVTLHWRMRSITNFCLANLAFADLCVGIFCVYQNIVTYLMESWVFGEFMCKMYYFINSLSTTASVLILIVICIERYLAIIHPMKCKRMMTLNRLRVTIIFVWILSAAISSPRFYYFKTISMPLPDNQFEILCLPDRTKYNSKLMDMSSMIMLFLIPLTIIIILYTHIGIVLWRSSNNRMPNSTPTPSGESISSSDYYREPDANIVQTVNLTLLPVATTTPQQGINKPEAPNSLEPHREQRSLFSSTFTCFECRSKSRRKRTNIKKMSSRKHSKAAQTPSLEIKLSQHLTECGQDFLMNCRACQKPYIHQSHPQHESVETTSFVQGGPENNSGEAKPDSPVSGCCGRARRLRMKSENAGTFTTNPPSPFCDRTCTCLDGAKTEPIVLVKFEKRNHSSKNGGKGQCTILINTKSCHGTTTPCRKGKSVCDSVENETDGDSPPTVSPSPPRSDCTNAHQLKNDVSRETGNDGPIVQHSGNGSICRRHSHYRKYSLEHKRNLSDDSGISTNGRHQDGSLCSCENNLDGSCSATCPSCGITCLEAQQLIKCQHHFPPPKIVPPLPNAPKRVRRMRITRSNKYGTSALQSRRRIIRMLIVVVLAFALCHLPFHARKVWQYWSPKWAQYQAGSFFSTMLTPITFLIMYANSAINPILYAFMSKKFRMSFKDLLCCRMRHSLRISRNASIRSTHAVALSQAAPGL